MRCRRRRGRSDPRGGCIRGRLRRVALGRRVRRRCSRPRAARSQEYEEKDNDIRHVDRPGGGSNARKTLGEAPEQREQQFPREGRHHDDVALELYAAGRGYFGPMAKARAMATHYIKWADFMVWPDLHQEDWHSAKPGPHAVLRTEGHAAR